MRRRARRLNALVEARRTAFLAGNHAARTGHQDFPLALQREDRLIVLHRPEDMARWFQANAAARAAEGREIGTSSRIVCCCDRAGTIRVEMLHATRLAVSGLRHWPGLCRRKIRRPPI